MFNWLKQALSGVLDRSTYRRWARAAGRAEHMPLRRLRKLRSRARRLYHEADRVSRVADARLAVPRIGTDRLHAPPESDWSLRPELWRAPVTPAAAAAAETRTHFGGEATLFHDCAISEITARQIRNTRGADLAPYGFRLDVFRFDGSFLSLVLELPTSAAEGLKRHHLVRLATVIETEKPLELFARLNIRHGPNTEQIVRELPPGSSAATVEFDLAYTNVNEKRVERMWLDLIFGNPEMNLIILRDVVLSRRPRAAL